MKRALPTFLVWLAACVVGCSPASKEAPTPAPEQAKPGEKEPGEPHVARDAEGRPVITLSAELQKKMAIQVQKLAVTQVSPEIKGYGRVLDPASLISLVTDLAAARATYSASSNELARLKTLIGQGNSSERALQTAQAAAVRDQLAVQSAQDRLTLTWGKALATQTNLTGLVQSLTALTAALVRVDLPIGEAKPGSPNTARLVTLFNQSLEAVLLGPTTSMDPQMQGQGFLCLASSGRLVPGEAVTGYLQFPGPPLTGVIIPREAVVRAEGAGWIYVPKTGGFTRIEIPLDHPTPSGWFLPEGTLSSDSVVTVGAQQLLSLESKGQSEE
jgi:hypothetical protein